MTTKTMTPERKVVTAIAKIAAVNPNASAIRPAERAPIA
jgi:hypothetical protein